jgi:16S rRNA (guanine1516-N2)-methyltransferase
MINFNQMNDQWPQKGIGKNHDLCKAVSITRKPRILDATAGLGRDTFIFAKMGCEVTLLERHPSLIEWLENALHHLDDQDLGRRMHFHPIDALCFLKDCEYFDVIYLDPMFPGSNRTALAKKNMQLLQSIVGNDDDSDQLLDLAKKRAKNRVVVKRHKLAPYLNKQKPSLSFKGKTTRYDVYLISDDANKPTPESSLEQ